MRILDLCCGLGGWSNCWRDRGHTVVGIDTVPPADLIADVRTLVIECRKWDVVFASPPCTEFSREGMPWSRKGITPDMTIVEACWRIAHDINPPVFIMENVKSAQKWIGKAKANFGSRFLWGWFPKIACRTGDDLYGKWRMPKSSQRARLRSKIPERLALAVMHAITGD